MKLSDYDYDLPECLIASHPAPVRDESRLMLLERAGERVGHAAFRDLTRFLRPGDALVVNETRVFPARLLGHGPSGGKVEILLLRRIDHQAWEALGKPGRRLKKGAIIRLEGDAVRAEVMEILPDGRRVLRLIGQDVEGTLSRVGRTPLPPYLRREETPEDRERYQTVYAKVPGAVAAPTAGLHFTPDLLAGIREMGVDLVPVLLHVGAGTFRPVTAEDPRRHRMESEYYEIGKDAADRIARARGNGGRVIAVGTTTVRCLETSSDPTGAVREGSGWTEMFIHPPYRFRATDALITNFHLPCSTLLMLVSAFAGREFILRAYREAVSRGYRFYSYGDAMLIL